MEQTVFLPAPRNITILPGELQLMSNKLILLDTRQKQNLLFTAQRWQSALKKYAQVHWEIYASSAAPAGEVGVSLRVDPARVTNLQGYDLLINSGSISVTGGSEAGVFYGVCTLIQLLEQSNPVPVRYLPNLRILDFPDFPARGVMIDISRDKVPTLETMFKLVDRLAEWKINQLQLYTEHTFAYRNHPKPWEKASPFTGDDILNLDEFCRERFIELVPNQNSFGHMHRWLTHPEYRGLAEAPNGIDYPWGGHSDEPFSLCPIDPGSIQLIRDLYDELLPHFSSKMINVGCDETWDLGQGRSKEECTAKGTGRVYLEFLLKINREVQSRGRRMQFWGDIIIQHPELVPELPPDVIALEWGYDADHPFNDHCKKFAEAGLDFYVCPGTSSWNTLAGRTDNALENLRSAAESGLQHHAIGYLNTDWGDSGHWQPLPISYLGFAAGAAYSWSWEANRNLDISPVVSLYGFDDRTGIWGQIAYDLGNVYRSIGFEPGNASALFLALQAPLSRIKEYQDKVSVETIHKTLVAIDAALALIPSARSESPDHGLIEMEYRFVGRALKHACYRMLLALGSEEKTSRELAVEIDEIIEDHKSIWLARNRPGGLNDSVARFSKIKQDYQA